MRSIFSLCAFESLWQKSFLGEAEKKISYRHSNASLVKQQTKPSKSNMPLTELDKEIALGIKNIIDAQPGIHYSIPYLAEKAAMSESRLKRLFKIVLNTTLYAYLSQQRMHYAMELLQQNQKTIRQITKLTGFKTCSNFTRAFKKHTGLPPAKYRKQTGNKL